LESTPSSSKAKPGGKKKTRQMASRLRGWTDPFLCAYSELSNTIQ
jgi:hypothetical protein